jgi:urease gamma subunit
MKTGILETRDVLEAVNEIAIIIIKHAKDGVQISDISAIVLNIMNSDDTKKALVKAVENVTAVPAELADIDLAEGLELGKVQLEYLPKILAALKG